MHGTVPSTLDWKQGSNQWAGKGNRTILSLQLIVKSWKSQISSSLQKKKKDVIRKSFLLSPRLSLNQCCRRFSYCNQIRMHAGVTVFGFAFVSKLWRQQSRPDLGANASLSFYLSHHKWTVTLSFSSVVDWLPAKINLSAVGKKLTKPSKNMRKKIMEKHKQA